MPWFNSPCCWGWLTWKGLGGALLGPFWCLSECDGEELHHCHIFPVLSHDSRGIVWRVWIVIARVYCVFLLNLYKPPSDWHVPVKGPCGDGSIDNKGWKIECRIGLIKGVYVILYLNSTWFQGLKIFVVRTYLKPWRCRVGWTLLLFVYWVDDIDVKRVDGGYYYCKISGKLTKLL